MIARFSSEEVDVKLSPISGQSIGAIVVYGVVLWGVNRLLDHIFLNKRVRRRK